MVLLFGCWLGEKRWGLWVVMVRGEGRAIRLRAGKIQVILGLSVPDAMLSIIMRL